MISKDVKRLLLKLNDPMTRALEGAAGLAVGRGHYEVTVEHLLLKLLEGDGDMPLAISRLGADPGRVGKALTDTVERFKTGNAGRPAFSPLLLELIERAFVAGSVHHGLAEVRSGALLEAYLEADAFATSPAREAMRETKADDLRDRFFDLVDGSDENRITARGGRPLAKGTGQEGETALDIYTESLTEKAREGGIDPIFGRDREIRQVIDVLSRRRKNNPILVGEAGVGKTAVVEGLALRIAAGDVPDSLKEAEIASLDLGSLQAGAGVKGEFEARMKAVIEAVRDAPKPTILFIDEAHTLVGAGGAAG
ncbi:MAG: AAA family ATPase, partial [Bacteroidota bacterium]